MSKIDWSKELETIQNHLRAGGKIMVSTYTQSKIYGPNCVEMFLAKSNGLYVKRGKKSVDCINHCKIVFSKLPVAA